jgi:hypothetical protein
MGSCCEPAHASTCSSTTSQHDSLPPGLVRRMSPATARSMVLLPKSYPFSSPSSSCMCSRSESPCFCRRARHLKHLKERKYISLSPILAHDTRGKSDSSGSSGEWRSMNLHTISSASEAACNASSAAPAHFQRRSTDSQKIMTKTTQRSKPIIKRHKRVVM